MDHFLANKVFWETPDTDVVVIYSPFLFGTTQTNWPLSDVSMKSYAAGILDVPLGANVVPLITQHVTQKGSWWSAMIRGVMAASDSQTELT